MTDSKPRTPENRPSLLRRKMFWVGLLYFAEGLPLGIFYDVFPVHFRQQGVDLRDIGLVALLGLAWTLKYLWAPVVSHYRHHRRWMAGVEFAMAAVMITFALHHNFGPWVWVAIGLFTVFSATNDTSIDGYTIEMLDKHELGLANGLRIGFYRVGMLGAGFLLVLSDYIGWAGTYLGAAALMVTLGLACLQAPPEQVIARRHRSSIRAELGALIRHPLALAAVLGFLLGSLWLINRTTGWSKSIEHFWDYAITLAATAVALTALRHRRGDNNGADREALEHGPIFGTVLRMLRRPMMGPVVLFILIFKLGDSAMGFMVKPFWVDAGFSASAIGMVSVNIGLALSIAGGIIGGWVTDRIGIFHALWMLGLAQALSNLCYAGVAAALPLHPSETIPLAHTVMLYGASGLESFTSGLGTGAFLAFLMAIVDKSEAATTEYALLSSIFALSRSVANWAGGYGAEHLGYADYFLLTFFLSFPAYLLLPWVRRMLGENGRDETAPATAG